MRRILLVCSSVFSLLFLSTSLHAAVADRPASRFDRLVTWDAVSGLGIVAETPDAIADFADGQSGWASFRSRFGSDWRVHVDRRSGAPLLVEGPGIPWFAPGEIVDDAGLESKARAFLSEFEGLFRIRNVELRLNASATSRVDADRAVVAFDRVIDGVPYEDQRFVLYVVRGNLVSFGTGRWGTVGSVPEARYGEESARSILYAHMGIVPSDRVEELESGTLWLTAAPPASAPRETRWTGPVGQGLGSRLVRRFVLRVAGEPGSWVGKVDAVTGEVVALYDDDKYAQVKGSVYPVASDGDCAKGGCLRADFPMPYSDVNVGGTPGTANDAGIFECTGGTTTTTLVGPYVRISDACGAVNESTVCDEDLDLGAGVSGATNCTVAAGESAGNTHASRSGFYTINRIKEKGRHWLPSNGWLQGQVQVNVNVNSTCNATWSGQLNMYRQGGGCRNTAETAGVLNHEFGHGLDQNDGGGYDNPSEGYADVIAILSDRASCVGRGFFESGTCSGYGDTCLTCTGIRDMDWAARVGNTPTTPANFTQDNCGGGSGPCGKEVHCESYPPSEAMYDLAARDLPASGMDAITSWQTAERLFYKSRQGSGGNAFNCSLPSSDGCNANGWYNTLRVADDDDGNLSNGTPHAGAIFAAFNRHALACGSAADNSNQSTSSCPALSAPSVSTVNGSGAVTLNWPAVANASSYRILRTEVSCDFTQNVIATVAAPGTQYVDTDLPNGTTFYYRVQAVGANSACDSPVSACAQGTPQPFAGTIKFNQPAYACSSLVQISVLDANIGAGTTIAQVSSTVETTPETVLLTETSPGSAKYVGTIQATGSASSNGDGLLAIADGATITATYLDADDGVGGANLTRTAIAGSDCVPPQISAIQTTGVTDVRADVRWTTNELSTSVVRWGENVPPDRTATTAGNVTSHVVALEGLQACTVYSYGVESGDAPGNVVTDNRGGQYYSFETQGNFGDGLQPCRAGKLTVLTPTVGCSQTLQMKVVDLDLNLSTTATDSVVVTVTSTTETTPENVTLVETGVNTSIFTGSIPTTPNPALHGDGLLSAASGDLLTATYNDASAGTGVPAVSFQTAIADCASPAFSNVRVTDIGDDVATVRWDTQEPSSSKVEWGPTPALGNVVTDAALVQAHAITIRPFLECARVYFRVTSTDAYGNTRVYDASGTPFEFNAFRIPGIFRDEFESATGWTLEGEWQIQGPEGKGTSPGDPTTAFQGTRVLGLDLSGLGAKPGDYEPNSSTRAISPVINASSLAGGQLKFRRWLNVGGGAVAYVEVKKNNAWNTVWNSNGATGVSENAWGLQSVDIGAFADANAQLQIAFRVTAGFSQTSNRAGWNVDRFVVKSSNQPDFDVCGGCGGAPTFAGLDSAQDVAGCQDTGVALSWKAAPAWGTGAAGTYAVYRSTDPAFVPSASNRVAAGIAGTSYTDTSAPNDTTLYYVVRAENAETCSTGPANGGVTDANLVRRAARDDTSQPGSGTVAASVRATAINDAHVRLAWTASPTASTYRILRSQSPQGPYSEVAQVTGTFWEDKDQLADSANRYYRVQTADACGNVEP